EAALVLAHREVAVREAADAVEPLDVAQVALAEHVLDRERVREQAQLVEALAGLAELAGDLVAVPELGLEIGSELVVDDEACGRHGQKLVDERARELGSLAFDDEVALLHRREPDALARNVAQD